ncbi:hypothetical protein BHE74_00050762 [Ensete ventricosum]|nr:hypothetical protein BHE74_00050762 [Ensete ventricosum]RZS11084.1 hypothetical protein BHM03_00042393 [Ensete ventricosum]
MSEVHWTRSRSESSKKHSTRRPSVPIIVAHRLSTIRNAVVIVVVQADRVAELGSHDSLIRDEGRLYSSFICFQQTTRVAGSDAPSSSLSALVAFPRPDNSESRRLSCSSPGSISADAAGAELTGTAASGARKLGGDGFRGGATTLRLLDGKHVVGVLYE